MGTEHLMLYVIGFVHIKHVDAVNDLFALIHLQFNLTDSECLEKMTNSIGMCYIKLFWMWLIELLVN